MAWLKFEGTALFDPASETWELVPLGDRLVRILMARSDVSIDGTVLVKQGAHALFIGMPPQALTVTSPQGASSGSACDAGKSSCLGGIEYCCDLEVVGKCHGRWSGCP